MMRTVVMQEDCKGVALALLDGRVLMDYAFYPPQKIEAEQVYLGKVDRVVKGMNAAFVKLTSKESGFLPFSEALVPLKGGDSVLVQVKKPPVGEKAAYLTQDISLAGDLALLLPFSKFVSVSSRARDKQTFAPRAKALRVEGMGLVLRSAAEDATDEEIAACIDALAARFRDIVALQKRSAAPCLLSGGLPPLQRFLRDQRQVDSLVLDATCDVAPEVLLPVQRLENAFQVFEVNHQLSKALSRHVWLKSGGFLVIDVCEALTVIDVNTGKFMGGKGGSEETFLRLNLEAATEIARLMRLRSMGGVILVDFIDMIEPAHREQLLQRMTELSLLDPVKCVIHGFTTLGLMEITRKKTSSALSQHADIPPCPVCHGTGLMKEEL